MSKRKCPWCGGENLIRVNSMGPASAHETGSVYWEDRECGYREVTTPDEEYDNKLEKFVERGRVVKRFHKPRPPLPVYEQPEYLRTGKVADDVPKGQQMIEYRFEKVKEG